MTKDKKVQPDEPVQDNNAVPESEVPETGNPENAEAEVEAVSELDQLKIELADQQAKYLYLQAEYQNFRKRAARDISDARAHAVEDTLMPFLSVADFLGMAGVAAEKSDNLDALKAVRDKSPVAISAGERLYTRWDYKRMFDLMAADFIQEAVFQLILSVHVSVLT